MARIAGAAGKRAGRPTARAMGATGLHVMAAGLLALLRRREPRLAFVTRTPHYGGARPATNTSRRHDDNLPGRIPINWRLPRECLSHRRARDGIVSGSPVTREPRQRGGRQAGRPPCAEDRHVNGGVIVRQSWSGPTRSGQNNNRATCPLWITGSAPPGSWRSLRQHYFPQHHRHAKHRNRRPTACSNVQFSVRTNEKSSIDFQGAVNHAL